MPICTTPNSSVLLFSFQNQNDTHKCGRISKRPVVTEAASLKGVESSAAVTLSEFLNVSAKAGMAPLRIKSALQTYSHALVKPAVVG